MSDEQQQPREQTRVAAVQPQLPPGPRARGSPDDRLVDPDRSRTPSACDARYGPRFTMRLLGQPPFVVLTDPAELRELFMAPPDVLHPGEGARLLEPIVGRQLGDPARRARPTWSSAS